MINMTYTYTTQTMKRKMTPQPLWSSRQTEWKYIFNIDRFSCVTDLNFPPNLTWQAKRWRLDCVIQCMTKLCKLQGKFVLFWDSSNILHFEDQSLLEYDITSAGLFPLTHIHHIRHQLTQQTSIFTSTAVKTWNHPHHILLLQTKQDRRDSDWQVYVRNKTDVRMTAGISFSYCYEYKDELTTHVTARLQCRCK